LSAANPTDAGIAAWLDWRSVFETSAWGIAVRDLGGRLIAANRAYRQMLGYAAEDLEGTTVLDLLHEEDRPGQGSLCAELLEGAPGTRTERRYRRKDGEVIWVRVVASTLPATGEAPGLVVALVEDITDRKRAEDEVRLSEAYLADAQRISRTGSWVLNPYTGHLHWSKEMYRICGFDPADGAPTYRMILERIHADDAAQVDAEVRRGIRELTDFEGEHRLMLPDGSVTHIHYLGHPVLGADGRLVECVGTIADITARKQAEAELNASLTLVRGLAARLMQVRDDERRRIARQLHETTAQDLAALKMNLAALDRSGSVSGDRERELLRESAALASQAMEDIRILSYLLHPPLLDEAGLASALRWYVAGFCRRSGIDAGLSVPAEFGRLPQEIETTLFRSVQESLINIHRHAKSPTAEIRLCREPDRVVLEVQDWGRGMPRESGDGSPGAGCPLGVGIAGMRERLQQLGGDLHIESGPGGTTVRAVVPLSPGCS
jgi:PAS domain S-box-containing protein